MNDPLVHARGIVKKFGNNKVLSGVDFTVVPGQVHALLGANGAGKSTLVKILSGQYVQDSGDILVRGQKTIIRNPAHAKRLGISVIHQELSLVPEFTVAENVFLGSESNGLLISRKELLTKASDLINQIGVFLNPHEKVKNLTVGEQQLVEIIKALAERPMIMIMDEPTASLSGAEASRLFEVIQLLKKAGVGIVYISHRLDELPHVCDFVTILRGGETVATGELKEFSSDSIIESMIGKQIDQYFPCSNRQAQEEIMQIVDLCKKPVLSNISFRVSKGEIVGLFGLVGAGQDELMRVIFGVSAFHSGRLSYKGEPVKFKSPRKARLSGIAFVTENRKEEGIIPELGTMANTVLASLSRFSRRGTVQASVVKEVSKSFVEKLDIKISTLSQPVKNLSGGNQQKIVLAKWLVTEPDLIILNEPTRGIDVSAKSEIYHLLDQLALEGKSILLASSEVEEVLGVCDRILVMFKGSIVLEVERNEATREMLMEYASGVTRQDMEEVNV